MADGTSRPTRGSRRKKRITGYDVSPAVPALAHQASAAASAYSRYALSAVTDPKPRRTTMTSSPRTSTSGFRKCRRAPIAASAAASSRFPSSARKWSDKRNCHT